MFVSLNCVAANTLVPVCLKQRALGRSVGIRAFCLACDILKGKAPPSRVNLGGRRFSYVMYGKDILFSVAPALLLELKGILNACKLVLEVSVGLDSPFHLRAAVEHGRVVSASHELSDA